MMPSDRADHDDLEIPFIFVPHGDPEPREWMARHPGWVKFPARFVPHGAGAPDDLLIPVAAGAGSEYGLPVGPMGGAALLWGLYQQMQASPKGGRHDAPPESFTPPPAVPQQPTSVPPENPVSKPGEGGFTALPEAPPQPDRVPETVPPWFMPGELPEEQGPLILNKWRNDGLPAEQQAHSWRARVTLKKTDAEVMKRLPDAAWNAHHLINVGSIKGNRDIFDAAVRAGWRTDEAANLAALPNSEEARQLLTEHGIERPVHRSGHPVWNEDVRLGLEDIRGELKRSGLNEGSDAYAAEARRLLEALQNTLRRRMHNLLKLGSVSDAEEIAYG